MNSESVASTLVIERTKILSYLWSIVRDHAVVEDLFQDVLITAMEKHDQITDAEHLLPWARHTARSKAIDYLRREHLHPRPLAGDVLDLLDVQWQDKDAESSTVRLSALARCLEKLTSRTRRLIELRYLEQRSGEEIAGLLGRQRGSIYKALSRAYQTLQECMQREIARGHGS